ncbi:MAG: hypothetical protein WCO56_08670 [Verrucomicrobiota bacterium]
MASVLLTQMRLLRQMARWAVRGWQCLVVVLMIVGSVVCAFGLYTVLIIKAPFRWMDEIFHRPADWMFLGFMLLAMISFGIFMFKLGEHILHALADDKTS